MQSPVVQAAEPFEASRNNSRYDSEQPPQQPREEAEKADHDPNNAIHRLATQTSHHADPEKGTPNNAPGRNSLDLTRTLSTRLSRHLTTRSLPDPGPPPDGGLKAWTQVALAFCLTSCK